MGTFVKPLTLPGARYVENANFSRSRSWFQHGPMLIFIGGFFFFFFSVVVVVVVVVAVPDTYCHLVPLCGFTRFIS